MILGLTTTNAILVLKINPPSLSLNPTLHLPQKPQGRPGPQHRPRAALEPPSKAEEDLKIAPQRLRHRHVARGPATSQDSQGYWGQTRGDTLGTGGNRLNRRITTEGEGAGRSKEEQRWSDGLGRRPKSRRAFVYPPPVISAAPRPFPHRRRGSPKGGSREGAGRGRGRRRST